MRGCVFFCSVLQAIRLKELIRILLLVWIFMTSSLHAAIFLGKGYSENLHSIRNTGQKPTVQKLFDSTRTLIREQELENSGVSELSWCNGRSCTWQATRRSSSSWRQKFMYSPTLYCAWENEWIHRNTKYWMDPMGTSGVGVENIPRTQHAAHPPRNPKVDGRMGLYTRRISRKNFFYADVLRHLFGKIKGNELTCVEI